MKIGTTDEAIARFEESGARVLRATLHEPFGDRQVWFVGQCGWLYLASDDALIGAANRMLHAPLVHEGGTLPAVEWADSDKPGAEFGLKAGVAPGPIDPSAKLMR